MEQKTFYQLVWENRLDWSGHLIPIRVEQGGLYLEAYVIAPPKPEPDQIIRAKIAYLPTLSLDTVWVKTNEIYPTARIIRRSNEEQPSAAIPYEKEHLPKRKAATKAALYKLEKRFPGRTWTQQELLSVFGKPANTPIDIEARRDVLTEYETKYCLITGERSTAYRIGRVIKVTNKDIIDVPETLEDLEKEYESCSRCELGDIRRSRSANLVFGRGPNRPKAMIIAESPWELEERDRRPLHPEAPAGGVLYRVMSKVGLNQDDWYMTNALICRPLLSSSKRVDDNKPKKDHIIACSYRLKRTLRAVSPNLVVLLGAYAYESWFGHPPSGGVGKNLGWVSIRNKETFEPVNYHVFFTYHPSYIARMEGMESGLAAKKLYLQHWKTVAEAYKEIVSE